MPPTIGARLCAMYQGARRTGTVLTVNDRRQYFRMRFDDFPLAEFDCTFSYNSSDWSYINTPLKSKNENAALQIIAKKFKTLIQVYVLYSDH